MNVIYVWHDVIKNIFHVILADYTVHAPKTFWPKVALSTGFHYSKKILTPWEIPYPSQTVSSKGCDTSRLFWFSFSNYEWDQTKRN